jgi:transposase
MEPLSLIWNEEKLLMCEAFRESATVEAWFKEHPEVDIVSRDRGKEFAKAATLGAPQAQQVVDRFHVVKNLSEVLQEILGHCRAEIRQRETPVPELEKTGEERTRPLPTAATWQQRTPIRVKKVHQARQASRDDRYEQMTTLRVQGLTQKEVAKRMGMSEKAVRNWLKRGAAPTNERQFRRRSVFDPYAASVLQRWQEGIKEAKQLYAEIRAQGFPGTVRIVQRFVQALRDDPEKIPLAPATAADRFSSKTATWLFIRDPKQLTTKKQAELELICQRSETAHKTYALTQQFMSMLRLRRGQEFEMWLSAVEASGSNREEWSYFRATSDQSARRVSSLAIDCLRSPSPACFFHQRFVNWHVKGRTKRNHPGWSRRGTSGISQAPHQNWLAESPVGKPRRTGYMLISLYHRRMALKECALPD